MADDGKECAVHEQDGRIVRRVDDGVVWRYERAREYIRRGVERMYILI